MLKWCPLLFLGVVLGCSSMADGGFATTAAVAQPPGAEATQPQSASMRAPFRGSALRVGAHPASFDDGGQLSIRPGLRIGVAGAGPALLRDARWEQPIDGGVQWWSPQTFNRVQHGFQLDPGPRSERRVGIDVHGAAVEVRPGGRSARFRLVDGPEQVRYDDLRVWDARGQRLPARFESTEHGLDVVIDAHRAEGAITVDPMITGVPWSAEGNIASAAFGTAAGAGDFNGDGRGDIAIGAPGQSQSFGGEGVIHIFLGGATGLPASASLQRFGGAPSAAAGTSIAVIDVDGDDRSDLIVGAPNFSNGEAQEGRVQVFLSSAAGPGSTASTVLEGGAAGALFGQRVAAAGDVDGDGRGDVLIGAPGHDGAGTDAGRVTLHLGTASGVSSTPVWTFDGEPGEQLGTVLSGVFDLNADGFADFALGSPLFGDGDKGRVLVFGGAAAGPSIAPLRTYEGEEDGWHLGAAIAQLGDVNGDAYADLLLGEPGWSDGVTTPGRVRLFHGSVSGPAATLSWTTFGESDGAEAGAALCGLGDLNADGYNDFAIGAPGWVSWATEPLGHVDVHAGGPAGPSGSLMSLAGDVGTPIGVAFASAGDTDGNGAAELLVLRPTASEPQAGEGLVERYDGVPGNTGYGYEHISGGGRDSAEYGTAVAIVGDVNGDGYDDVLGGAPGWDNGQSDEGGAFLRFGGSSLSDMPDWTAQSDQAGAHLGAAVAGGLDVNGDGYDDFAVAAPDWDDAEVDTGRVFLHFGSPAGPDALADWDGGGFIGGERAGSAIAMGDWNADGYADMATGMPDSDEPWGVVDAGAIVVVFGSPTGFLEEPYSYIYDDPPLPGGRWGSALASAGDVHGDGYEDLLVGAGNSDVGGLGAGAVYMIPGSPFGPDWTPQWVLVSTAPGQHLGASVAGAGDLDGDGFGDVLIGAPGDATAGLDAGWVGLYTGSSAGLATTPTQQWYGATAGSELGFAVAGLGDINGDGAPEAAFGAPGETHEGNVDDGTIYIYTSGPTGLGAQPWYDQWGYSPSARAGAAISSGGDVDGDGFSDFLGGAPTYSGSFVEHGSVRLFAGNRLDDRDPASPLRLDAFDTTSGQRVGTLGGVSLAGAELRGQIRAPIGRAPVRLRIEVEDEGSVWDGAGLLASPWTDSLFSGVQGAVETGPLQGQQGYVVRGAAQWAPSTGAPQLQSHWSHLGRAGHGRLAHFRTPPNDGDGDGQRDDTDCAPADPTIYHGAPDVPDDGIDQDCDGIAAFSCFYDDDEDGIGGLFLGYAESQDCAESFDNFSDSLSEIGGDCDDTDPTVLGGEPETCNGVDDDCDGALLEGEEVDVDEDGSPGCVDCDDSDVLVRPDFPLELCDGLDNDCDQLVGAEEADADGDGARACAGDCDDTNSAAYAGAPEPLDATDDLNCDGVVGEDVDLDGVLSSEGDCDDGDATISPQAPEVCDGVDNDCDGAFMLGERDDPDGDGALACLDCWEGRADVLPGATEACDGADTDCDGFLDPAELDIDEDGVSACAGDCDDRDAARFPGRAEDCDNGVDDDCSGAVDDDVDGDEDGHRTCAGDCDDGRAEVHPGALEICNGRDDDCNTLVDDGFDADGDGVRACDGDCNDADATVYLDAPAVCDDGQDNDCRSSTLETWDSDGDGSIACPPDGSAPDCWEGNATVYPDAPEVCDHVDSNCDGNVDEGFDADEDEWSLCGGDCDDTDARIEPGAEELCGDGVDQDCDGLEILCADPSLDIFVPLGCGCGGAEGAALLPALGLLGWRRRRHSPARLRFDPGACP